MRARLLVVAALACAGSAAAQEPVRVESGRYAIRTEGPREEAEEWLRVLEAAWPGFRAFFGDEPRLGRGERLSVSFHETEAAWREAIRAAGGTPPTAAGAGGYYDPVSRGVFLFRQPSTWYTRTLLIHEAAHQFHFLARTHNRAPAAGWYVEGVAEHLSHHTWDGTTLALGAVPLLSLEDRPEKALAVVEKEGFRLDRMVSEAPGRPESMHLVRFLATDPERAGRWETFARKLDQGSGATAALFGRAFGPPGPLTEGLRAWLPRAQQPWAVVHVDWEARGPRALRCRSGVVSACRVKAPVERVSARFVPPSGEGWSAGVLLQYASLDDYTVGLVDAGRSCRVHRRREGRWEPLSAAAPRPPSEGAAWLVEARRGTEGVAFLVNGEPIGTWPLEGTTFGLAVDHSTIDFTDIAWR